MSSILKKLFCDVFDEKFSYNETVDFENDWKVATILLGANNLCESCHNRSDDTPDAYEQVNYDRCFPLLLTISSAGIKRWSPVLVHQHSTSTSVPPSHVQYQ